MLCILELWLRQDVLEVLFALVYRDSCIVLVLDSWTLISQTVLVCVVDRVFDILVGFVHESFAVIALRVLLHRHHGEVGLNFNRASEVRLARGRLLRW